VLGRIGCCVGGEYPVGVCISSFYYQAETHCVGVREKHLIESQIPVGDRRQLLGPSPTRNTCPWVAAVGGAGATEPPLLLDAAMLRSPGGHH